MVISSSYINFLTIIVTDLSLNLTEGYLQNNKIVSHILIYQVYYIKESMGNFSSHFIWQWYLYMFFNSHLNICHHKRVRIRIFSVIKMILILALTFPYVNKNNIYQSQFSFVLLQFI